jgi:hypothetical protein
MSQGGLVAAVSIVADCLTHTRFPVGHIQIQ